MLDCGPLVALCGILALEIGDGHGVYHHRMPVVHGLWPQVPPYGTSACIPPKNLTDLQELPPCSSQLSFAKHEWEKHGSCAAADDAAGYFETVCEALMYSCARARMRARGSLHMP